jgi:hypothetical protein
MGPARRMTRPYGRRALVIAAVVVGLAGASGVTMALADGAVEGASFAGLTVPSPSGCTGTPTIDWGDGGQLTNGSCIDAGHIATGAHTYVHSGQYAGVAHYVSPNGARTASFTVDVGDAALSGAPVAVAGTAGTAFSGVVAHFTDANSLATASAFTATISWGDGAAATAGTIVAGGGGFDVTGSHAYAGAGSDAISVTILDEGGATVTVGETASITSAGLTAPPPASAQAAFTVVASGGRVVADAGASRPPGALVTSYAWNLDGHTGPQPSALCGPDVSQLSARLAPGSHTLTLNVTGAGGQVTTTTHQVVVPRPAGRAIARAAASAALTQVFVCSPGPADQAAGDVTGQGGPPAGCATEVQFGLADAVGCLDRIAGAAGWPKAENRIFKSLVGQMSVQQCPLCAQASAVHGAQVSLGSFESVVVSTQDPFVSTRPVRINGIDFTPRAGAAIVLLPNQNMIISSDATMSLGGIPIQTGLIELYVPKGNGTAGKVHIDDYTLSQQADRLGLGALPFDGSIGLDFAYHRSELPVHVTLPNVFTLGDGDPIEGAVTLSTDNGHGLHLEAVHVSVPDAFIGPLEITGLFFDYQSEGDQWSGGANLVFPEVSLLAAPPPPDQGFGLKNGGLDHIGATLAFDPAVELFPGIGLTHIGFTVGLNPTRFSGSAGLQAIDVANVDGTLLAVFPSAAAPYVIPPGAGAGLEPLAGTRLRSTSFAVGGDVSIATPVGEIPIGDGFLLYEFPDYVQFGGSFFYGFHDVFSIDGHITGFVQVSRRQFDIEAGLHACVAVLGCSGVDAAISSNGIAACWTQTIAIVHIHVGVGYHWGDSFPDVMLLGCDVGPYTARASRRQAGAGAPDSFTLPAGLPFANVRVRGNGNAPRVTLTGPNGEKLVTPDDKDLFADAAFALVRQPQSDTTFVGIHHPAAGTWTVTPQPGSVAVAQVASANGLPAPGVHARVTGNRTARVLHYRLAPAPGRVVSFVERGPATWRVLGKATRASGTLRFTPARGPAGTRQIVALISENGLAERQVVVASFHARAPALPPAPRHLQVRRAAGALRVSWSPSLGAARYLVTVRLSDGRSELFLRRAKAVRRLTVRGVKATASAVVRVSGLDAINHAGHARTKRVARRHAPRLRRLPPLRA